MPRHPDPAKRVPAGSELTLNCEVCGASFTYAYYGGNKRRSCDAHTHPSKLKHRAKRDAQRSALPPRQVAPACERDSPAEPSDAADKALALKQRRLRDQEAVKRLNARLAEEDDGDEVRLVPPDIRVLGREGEYERLLVDGTPMKLRGRRQVREQRVEPIGRRPRPARQERAQRP